MYTKPLKNCIIEGSPSLVIRKKTKKTRNTSPVFKYRQELFHKAKEMGLVTNWGKTTIKTLEDLLTEHVPEFTPHYPEPIVKRKKEGTPSKSVKRRELYAKVKAQGIDIPWHTSTTEDFQLALGIAEIINLSR